MGISSFVLCFFWIKTLEATTLPQDAVELQTVPDNWKVFMLAACYLIILFILAGVKGTLRFLISLEYGQTHKAAWGQSPCLFSSLLLFVLGFVFGLISGSWLWSQNTEFEGFLGTWPGQRWVSRTQGYAMTIRSTCGQTPWAVQPRWLLLVTAVSRVTRPLISRGVWNFSVSNCWSPLQAENEAKL